jgi:NAD(P)-dependent dehydrogenase (short-subunit alcohol dehydrogenase family)
MAVILVTGSSTGIGYATALTLARNGHRVYASMRDPKRSPQLKETAEQEKLELITLPMDVLDEVSVTDSITGILENENQVDVLVNNAGVGAWGSVEELEMDLFRRDMETNYFGTLRCIKAVLPGMRERRSGTIINVTSVAGKLYSNFHGGYCASKAAVEALSESLAQELAPFNVKVAMVQPGIVETPIFEKINPYPDRLLYPNLKRFMAIFAASLENHVQPSVVADVINDIVAGKTDRLRHPAGPDAIPLLAWRSSTPDEEWVNSVNIDDITWIENMEQNMGLPVRKYMEAPEMPVWH